MSNMEQKKIVKVVAAVIHKDNKIFCTQRGYGEFKDGWEFPGGKVEAGETPQQSLTREIKEELNTDIDIEDYIATIEYDYPKFHLSMQCFFATVRHGSLELLEHEAAKWLAHFDIESVDWLPPDRELVEKYLII